MQQVIGNIGCTDASLLQQGGNTFRLFFYCKFKYFLPIHIQVIWVCACGNVGVVVGTVFANQDIPTIAVRALKGSNQPFFGCFGNHGPSPVPKQDQVERSDQSMILERVSTPIIRAVW